MKTLRSLNVWTNNAVGVGIDESTAIVVRGGKLTVMGKSSVVVIDARMAKVPKGNPNGLQSGSDISLHVLKAGQTFSVHESRTVKEVSLPK